MKKKFTDKDIMEIYKSDAKKASDLMIEKHMDYVYSFLWKKFPTYMRVYKDEMFQACIVGMLDAIRTYNPDKGAFTTYSTPYIKHEAFEQVCFIGKEKSRHYAIMHQKIRNARYTLEMNGETVTLEKICKMTGLSRNVAEREMKVSEIPPAMSIDECVEPYTELQLSDDMVAYSILSSLSDKERKIVVMKVLDEMTYKEIADKLGMSSVHVKQVYDKCIKKLRKNEAA